MWPKAFTQLVELAPHLTRLVPLADRFLKDKAAGDQSTRDVLEASRSALETQRATVTDLSAQLRADIGSLASAQATQTTRLERELAELKQQLRAALEEALATKQAAAALEGRLQRLDEAQRLAMGFALVLVLLTLAVAVMVVVLLVRGH